MRFERKRPKRVSTIAGPAACHLATKAARPPSGVRAAAGTGNVGVCAKASATSWPKADSEASVPATAVVPLRNVRRPNAALSRSVAGSSVAEHLHTRAKEPHDHSPGSPSRFHSRTAPKLTPRREENSYSI